MRKEPGAVAVICVCTLALAGVASAWQGRMAGMGDPYGLVQDESDFLVNPAKIADGQGTKYYGNYRFTYGDFLTSKFGSASNDQTAVSGSRDASGKEYRNDVLLGAGFPVGLGRMGVFFNYSGKRSSFDGNSVFDSGFSSNFDMKSDIDNFALRLIYGQRLDCGVKVGGEVQIDHQREFNRFSNFLVQDGVGAQIFETNSLGGDLLPFMLPYDSSYWEVLAKAGVEGNVGPVITGLTLRGGSIISGDNNWAGVQQQLANQPPTSATFDTSGDVSGWKIGADLWARYPYSASITLPFVVRVDYSDKSRNGQGIGDPGFEVVNYPPFFLSPFPLVGPGISTSALNYNSDERSLSIEAGGGIDMALNGDTRVAAGLYFDYIRVKNDVSLLVNTALSATPGISVLNYGAMPDRTENLARLKLTGETKVNELWVVRGGLDVFGGIAQEDIRSNYSIPAGIGAAGFNGSLSGTHWGITGSLGATARCFGVVLEPFAMAGYQKTNLLDNSAQSTVSGFPTAFPWTVDKKNSEVLVGSGVSILF